MHQIQILLPLYDSGGASFPSSHYESIKRKLNEKFGGITMYSRAPVTGLWKEDQHSTVKDELIIYEILSEDLDETFWKDYRLKLQMLFQQDQILIKSSEVKLL